VSRDNLDENGWRRSERELAAGSGVMISLGLPVRKHFLRGAISGDVRAIRSLIGVHNTHRSEKASP
jgi:hypothetical protein